MEFFRERTRGMFLRVQKPGRFGGPGSSMFNPASAALPPNGRKPEGFLPCVWPARKTRRFSGPDVATPVPPIAGMRLSAFLCRSSKSSQTSVCEDTYSYASSISQLGQPPCSPAQCAHMYSMQRGQAVIERVSNMPLQETQIASAMGTPPLTESGYSYSVKGGISYSL